MNKTALSSLLIMLFVTISLTACSGGGGGGDGAQPTRAVITLSATGPFAATALIGGVEAVIHLPTGVTAKADLATPNPSLTMTAPGVVTAAGDAAGAEYVLATYQTSTATGTDDVDVYVAKASGFAAGDFAVLTCDIAAGHRPTAADFSVGDVKIKDLNGADIVGVTVGMTAEIR